MIKIFRYECRRLLCNKFFCGLLLVLLFYGWQVLNSVTILGVSHTAPFSPWSFGDYLSRMLPLLWIGALFFLTFFTAGRAQRAAVLTDATQVSPRRYALARCAAALTGTVLLALACLAERAVFRLVCMGDTAAPRTGRTGTAAGFCAGERLAAGQMPGMAGLCVDACPAGVYSFAAAGGIVALERQIFHHVSADAWLAGSRVCSAACRGCGTVRPAGSRCGSAGAAAGMQEPIIETGMG